MKPSLSEKQIARINRFLWRAQRTPIGDLIKTSQRLARWNEIQKRRKVVTERKVSSQTISWANELNQNGFVRLDGLLSRESLKILCELSHKKLGTLSQAKANQIVSTKNFWVRLLDDERVDGLLKTESEFVKFAIQKPIIDLVGTAMGELPILVDALLTQSEPTREKLSYSQLWHKDYDDRRTIKLFVYLTDVNTTADGPFTFYPKPETRKIGFTLKSHLTDEVVEKRLDQKIQLTGSQLSVFMVETSACLHMGSRLEPGHSRLMYTASFISAPTIYLGSSKRFWHDGKRLSDEENLIYGFS